MKKLLPTVTKKIWDDLENPKTELDLVPNPLYCWKLGRLKSLNSCNTHFSIRITQINL